MENPKYIVKDDTVWERYSDDLFQGYARVNPSISKGDPWLSYIGPKIPLATWRQILAFFKWTYEDSKGESQVRLYFNKDLGQWRAWAFPQERSYGMTTNEIPEKCDEECQKVGLGRGWMMCGTVHHHCSGGAFQSSTDRDNEATQNGIHVTVGKIDNKFDYDLHGRMVFRGVFYTDLDWSHWFEMPGGLETLPWQFRKPVLEHFLTRAVTEKDTFPSEWKDNVIKKAWTSPASGPPYGNLLPWDGPRHEDATDAKTGATTTRYIPSRNGNDKPLTKKERKLLRKLMDRAGPEDWEGWWDNCTKEDTEKLSRAAMATVQLCAASGIEIDELFSCLQREPSHLDPVQASAADQLHDLMEKEGVWPDELQDWIKTVITEGDVPAG